MRSLCLALCLTSLGCHAGQPGVTVRRESLGQAAARLHINYPFDRVFIRVFKEEANLEFWAANKKDAKMTLLKTFPVAAMSGGLGPKRKEGDRQVPEGFYVIDRFNPKSQFHLSLGLNYPNRSDRLRGDKERPGSDIFIHGNQVSIGCMAMTDPLIDEIYPACFSAGNQRSISVHVFPARLTPANLARLSTSYSKQAAFWRELKPIYDRFETTKVVPKVGIGATGEYRLE